MRPCSPEKSSYPVDRIGHVGVALVRLQPSQSGGPVRLDFSRPIGGFVRAAVAGVVVCMGTAEPRVQAVSGARTGWSAATYHSASGEHRAGFCGPAFDLSLALSLADQLRGQSRVPLRGARGGHLWSTEGPTGGDVRGDMDRIDTSIETEEKGADVPNSHKDEEPSVMVSLPPTGSQFLRHRPLAGRPRASPPSPSQRRTQGPPGRRGSAMP